MGDMIGYSTDGNVALDSTIKRSGEYSLRVSTVSNTGGWLKYNIRPLIYGTDNTPAFYMRCAVYLDPHNNNIDANTIHIGWEGYITIPGGCDPDIVEDCAYYPGWITFEGDCLVPKLYFQIQYNYCSWVTILAASGTRKLYPKTWYLIEMYVQIGGVDPRVQVKIDGILDLDYHGFTGQGCNITPPDITNIKLGTSGGYLGEISNSYIDDIALNDTEGGVDDSWIGDGKIIVMKPGGDTATLDLTPSAAVDHYTLVDDIPTDEDTTYVGGNVVDEEDMYTLVASGLVDVGINRVWTEARSKKTAANNDQVALITKASGGAEVSGGDVTLYSSYTKRVLGAEQTVNPVDSAAWEVADIDLIEIGPRTR